MVATQGICQVSTLTDPRLRVWRNQALIQPRTLYSLTELSATLNLGINNADIDTLASALLERMYYCKVNGEFVPPPEVAKDVFNDRLGYFADLVCDRIGAAAPVSLDQVVEMYVGRKRTIYANARDQLYTTGWKDKYAWLKAFVKVEKVNPNKAARCIQPRDPVYNVRLAAYIKPIEHRVYHAIDKIFGDGPTVIKGYNVTQMARIMRGKWRSFKNPVALGLDAMKFDMHVSPKALKWEHSIYNRIYRSKELVALLKPQINQRGVGRCKNGSLRYTVVGRRASGDMNTALGNCTIMCGLIHSYAKSKKVHVKLMNNGDDCVIMMERCHLDHFMEGLDAWFLEMGFRMTAEKPVYSLPEIEFCQMRPIEYGDKGEIIMVRNIPTALRKDSLITVPIPNETALQGWMTAVGMGGLALTGGIPIMQNFYRRLQQLGNGRETAVSQHLARISGMHMMGIGIDRQFSPPTAMARLNVFKAWGITPDQQVALEEYYDSYTVEHGPAVGVDSLVNYTPLLNVLSR